MNSRFAPVLLALAMLTVRPLPAAAAPANSLKEMWSEFRICIETARMDKDAEITVRFSLKRNGALNGRPIITYFNVAEDTEAQRRIAESVAKTLNQCLPLPITDALGGAIAGRPLVLRIHGGRKEMAT